MSRDYELQHRLDDEGEKYDQQHLAIKPEGWVDSIVFEYGNIHACGQAEAGIGVRISSQRGGGVLTLDDMLAIHDMIGGHIKRLSKKTKRIGLM